MNIAHWNWAVWTLFALYVISLCAGIGLHGKPRTGDYNGWASFSIFLATGILLYCGGFFQ